MTQELVSLTIIMAVAAVSPIVAQLIPGKFIPQTVLLLAAGAALGPYGFGLIQVNDAVKLLSELGMAFLFLLAGYEIDPKRLAGHQGKVGLATWVVTFGLAWLVVTLIPFFSKQGINGIATVIALTTTALGTLMPILKERSLEGTPIGDAIISYGTWGELGPIIAMAILLSTRRPCSCSARSSPSACSAPPCLRKRSKPAIACTISLRKTRTRHRRP